jgi:hypothetical protein
MPYFILIPAFLAWLLVCGAAAAVSARMPALRSWRPYVVQVGLWASAGILAGNALLILLLALGLQSLDRLQDGSAVRSGLQVVWGLGVLLGPFAVSTLGWLAGACLGVVLAWRRGRR